MPVPPVRALPRIVIAAGNAVAAAEASHLTEVAGIATLWQLASGSPLRGRQERLA